MSHQPGFFDFDERLEQLNAHGNPLKMLEETVDFEMFRPILKRVRSDKGRKSNAGRKPYDVVLMFKMLILKSLYNLSFEQVEYQVRDRISFMAFLGLRPSAEVPDEKTLWLFHDQLARLQLVEELFEMFDGCLVLAGFNARKGNLIDASIVPAPIQRNKTEENEQIKEGKTPESFEENPAKARQKDTDARWTKRRGRSHFGYKNHIAADAKHKLIRKYEVTDAATHDSQMTHLLLDDNNEGAQVYADSAYASKETSAMLEVMGYEERICGKASRHKTLTDDDKEKNKAIAKVRSRVEHVFGRQSQFGGKLMRCIGIVRARAVIGLQNLTYNMDRFVRLQRPRKQRRRSELCTS